MKKKIEGIIESIASDLVFNKIELEDHGGVYSGKIGIALFLASYHKYSHNQTYLDFAYSLTSDALNNINKEQGLSLSGVAGIGWAIKYLNTIQVLDENEIAYYLNHLNNSVIHSLENDITHKYYDLMHGYIGKLIYLISSYQYSDDPQKAVDKVLESIDYFEQTAIVQEEHVYWTQAKFTDKPALACLGMAHGVPSIISFLCLLSKEFRLTQNQQNRANSLIEKACNWILSMENQFNTTNSLFPLFSPPEEKHLAGYLAWCYGDLSLSFALIRAGKILKDDFLYNQGVRIAEACTRKDFINACIPKDSKYIDSTLCHGTLGLVYQFRLLHQETQKSVFHEAESYWLDVILKRTRLDNIFCNLKSCTSSRSVLGEKQWKVSPSLLDGASGIGLVLLDYCLPESDIKRSWNRILLLDLH